MLLLRSPHNLLLLLFTTTFFTFLPTSAAAWKTNPIPPKYRFWKRNQYTPHLFFTITSKGEIPSCDAMEKIISELETELNIHIQRLDVCKSKYHQKLHQKIDSLQETKCGIVPFLYHRESRQTICGLAKKDKVRMWAKGMWLDSSDWMMEEEILPSLKSMKVMEEKEEEEEEEDVVDLVKEGKEKMKKRMEEDAEKRGR